MSWKGLQTRLVIVVAAVVVVGCSSKRSEEGQGDELPPKSQKIREAAVAGLFYPAGKEELARMIDDFLSNVDTPPMENLQGLVCPHAGYRFSGPTAAYSYKQLTGRDIRTAVVMAPSHYAEFRGASIPDVEAYRTPLGKISLSPKAKELAKLRPLITNPPCRVRRPAWWRQSPKKAPPPGEDTPHTWEHSLEVQLPFLQRALKDFEIVPIVFAPVEPVELVDVEKVAQVLADHIDDKTILVASSDLSHYAPYEVAQQKDARCTKAICDLDIEAMKKQEACGKAPILTLMHIAKKKGWKARLLDYRNSGDTAGDKSGVVGYAAIAFFEPEETENAGE